MFFLTVLVSAFSPLLSCVAFILIFALRYFPLVTDQHAAFAAFPWLSFPPGLVAERILFKDQVAPFNV